MKNLLIVLLVLLSPAICFLAWIGLQFLWIFRKGFWK